MKLVEMERIREYSWCCGAGGGVREAYPEFSEWTAIERITEANVKKRLAIVLDNNIYSAPVIQEKISGGMARITGNFTTEEAHDLAIVLRCHIRAIAQRAACRSRFFTIA